MARRDREASGQVGLAGIKFQLLNGLQKDEGVEALGPAAPSIFSGLFENRRR